MTAMSLLQCRQRLGYSHGIFQPSLAGQIALKAGASIPIQRLEAVMGHVFAQIDAGAGASAGAVDAVHSPRNALALCAWVLNQSHRLQRAHRLTVLQPPCIVSKTIQDGMMVVAFIAPSQDAQTTLSCLQWVVNAVNSLVAAPVSGLKSDLESDLALVAKPLASLARLLKGHQVKGVNTERMLASALENHIPFAGIGFNTYQMGHGVRSRWLRSTFTDETGHLGAEFARDKLTAASVLALHGLPVAENRKADTAQEAVTAAAAIGYPVVVKAANLDGGVGVHAGLVSAEQVVRCFEESRSHTRSVMVEKHHVGADYRLTVVHGEVVKAIQRIPGGVVGDGEHTVRELLQAAVADEHYRRRMRERGKTLLQLDAEATELLQNKGLVAESVLAAGEFVALRRRANVSTGGTTVPVNLPDVHTDNSRLAVRAAQALRLDVAGVDLIVPDIGQSWMQTGGIVCEVNGQPQFGESHSPGLYARFFNKLMGGDGRIPVVVVVCAKPPSVAVVKRWQAVFAKGQGGDALVFDGLLYIAGECVNPQKRSNHRQAAAALANREVHKALFVLGQAEVLAQGFPVQMATNAVILNPQVTSNKTLKSTQSLTQALRPHVTGGLHVSNDLDGQSWQHLLDTPEPAAT